MERTLYYARPRAAPVYDPVFTIADPNPICILPTRHEYLDGAWLVAEIADGEEYDAARGPVLLVHDAGVLRCGEDAALRLAEITWLESEVPPVVREVRDEDPRAWTTTRHLWSQDRVLILEDCEEMRAEMEFAISGLFHLLVARAWTDLVTE